MGCRLRDSRGNWDSAGAGLLPANPVSAVDLEIMRRMDEMHLAFSFAGSRMLRDRLRQEGIEIGR